MKKIIPFLIAAFLFGCSGMMPKLEHTGSAPTYGTKSTGDSYSAAEHNELYNAVVDNDTRLDTAEAVLGVAFTDGSSLTGVDAATGDSATSFFDAGTCEHERGCLEADLSAYGGIPAISGGSTSQAIEYESDCSDNTSGLCIDSDDHHIYWWNGSSMVKYGGSVIDTDSDGSLTDETPEFSTVTASQFSGLVIGDCSDGDNCTADEILDNENISPTGGAWDLSALTLTFPAGGWYFADEDSGPDTAGQIKYDNNITGLNDGGIVWYDDDEIKYLLDYATLPSAQGQIPEYNSTTDKWEPVQRSHINSTAKTSAYTIGTDLSEECYGGVFYVTSAATLTACDGLTAGMNFTVVTIGATAVSLDVQSDDLMYLDGTALDDGDKATNTSTTGDTITCIYYDATGWYCWSGSPDGDHWADGGP